MSHCGITLLTGATGLLGRYLLRDLALRGMPVAVLVRPKGRVSAEARVRALVAHLEAEIGRPLPATTCLEGDVTEPNLGLSEADRGWAAFHCGRVLHGAASLSFRGKARQKEPWLSNFAGTRHVAAFCLESGIRELHHVSTAYVCGLRDDLILESELDLGQGFRNDYEESKCAAETWLRREAGIDSLTVYRPAVITGDWATGFATAYHGLYRFFQYSWLISEQARRGADGYWDNPVRLRMTGHEPRNLVPVDWVSAAIARLVASPAAHGATYHLTPAVPTRSSQIERSLADYFLYRGTTFVGPDGAPDDSLSDAEKFFYDYINIHQEYLRSEPLFDASHTRAALPDLPCPAVDEACLRRLIDFGVRDRWGRGGVSAMRRVEPALAQG